MNKLIIIGAGGFGKEVAWLAERINLKVPTWEILGFVDDNAELQNKVINGYPILGGVSCLKEYEDVFVVCAIGSSKVRKVVINRLHGVKFATLIDPSVTISNKVNIGEGCIICANTIITVNIDIGNHVIINLGCTIGHDSQISNFVTLNPSVNVSGLVKIGECVEVGTGTQVIQNKIVESGSVIGAGSVVVKDIPANCTAVGIPAKPIKFFE